MDLISAVKSARPFRREGEKDYWDHEAPGFFVAMESILATDWETKPESRAGELCRECFDDGIVMTKLDYESQTTSYGCNNKDHSTPFKWREVPADE